MNGTGPDPDRGNGISVPVDTEVGHLLLKGSFDGKGLREYHAALAPAGNR